MYIYELRCRALYPVSPAAGQGLYPYTSGPNTSGPSLVSVSKESCQNCLQSTEKKWILPITTAVGV